MKRKLPFDPTPKKHTFVDKENASNGGIVAKAKSKGNVEESFALNFSTFIENNGDKVDASQVSFDLSDLRDSGSDDDDADALNDDTSVAGITATTFVLENKVRKESATSIDSMKKAKNRAVLDRQDAEQQRRDVEEEVRRLRAALNDDPTPAPSNVQHDAIAVQLPNMAVNALSSDAALSGLEAPKEVPKRQLLRFATSPNLKKSEHDVYKLTSAASTTDLARLRKQPLDSEAKKSRMQGLKSISTEQPAGSGRSAAPEPSATGAMDPTERRARTKSRPQKLKMLRAVSRLETVDSQMSLSAVEAGFSMKSPSSKLGSVRHVSYQTQWLGDGDVAASSLSLDTKTVFQMPAMSSSEESKSDLEEGDECDESESMDEHMAVDLTCEQSMQVEPAGSRYSIFAAPATVFGQEMAEKKVQLTADQLMDVTPAQLQAEQSLDQLNYVTHDPKLAGLFGEHLKGMRADSLLRILDDIDEYKTMALAQERLSLARSVFQMYLSESSTRENCISLEIVPDVARKDVRKVVRANEAPEGLFTDVEDAIRLHLAIKEMPTFVNGDVYRTLGFKRVKNKKPAAVDAFENLTVVAAPASQPSALFRTTSVVPPVVVAAMPVMQENVIDNDKGDDEDYEDIESDQEEESSNSSPMQPEQQTNQLKQQLHTPPATTLMDTTLDSILSDPQERESFLSFVSSIDNRSAKKTGTNLAFLVKVSQFNAAAEAERPEVAHSIYDSFLASPAKTDVTMRRDQKGQVDVDVSELRKRQLVSRYRQVIEQPANTPGKLKKELKKGFFDKAARDVEAFVEPNLHKYNAAKKDGSIVMKKTNRVVPVAAKVVVAASDNAPINISLPSGMTLARMMEMGGSALTAFVEYASDVGRKAPAEYLSHIYRFKQIENASERTAFASQIMDTFVRSDSAMVLSNVPSHIRSGPETRWGIFAKRNMIKLDFFDSITDEVVQFLESTTWSRFASECQQTTSVADLASTSSFLSESSGLERTTNSVASAGELLDESKFEYGMTLERGAIAEEIRRRLREDAEEDEDDNSSSDSGVEDSPDSAVSMHLEPGTVSARGLDLSPSTAADLLSRLEGADPLNDTVMLPRKRSATVPRAQNIFSDDASELSELEIRPTTRPQSFIPVKRVASQETFEERHAEAIARRSKSGVWPSRAAKMGYSEGLDAKKRIRFIVLKNKSLYICSSEAEYKKSREPLRVLDMDNLVRLNIVRDTSSGGLVSVGATRWTLRVNFEGLDFTIVLSADSEEIIEWKEALLESSPHVTM